jgi:hypothetical protein
VGDGLYDVAEVTIDIVCSPNSRAQYDIGRAQDEIRAGLKKITPIVDAA